MYNLIICVIMCHHVSSCVIMCHHVSLCLLHAFIAKGTQILPQPTSPQHLVPSCFFGRSARPFERAQPLAGLALEPMGLHDLGDQLWPGLSELTRLSGGNCSTSQFIYTMEKERKRKKKKEKERKRKKKERKRKKKKEKGKKKKEKERKRKKKKEKERKRKKKKEKERKRKKKKEKERKRGQIIQIQWTTQPEPIHDMIHGPILLPSTPSNSECRATGWPLFEAQLALARLARTGRGVHRHVASGHGAAACSLSFGDGQIVN